MKLIDALILVLFGHAGVWSHFADVESNPQIIDRTNTETSIKDQNSRDLLDRLFENLLNNEAEKEAVEGEDRAKQRRLREHLAILFTRLSF